MRCQVCEFENVPGLSRCVRCDSALDLAAVSFIPPRAAGRSLWTRMMSPWRQTTRRVTGSFRRIWAWFGWLFEWLFAPRDVRAGELLWSILPGAGHLWGRRTRTGWIIIALWAGSMLAALFFVGEPTGWWFLQLAVVVHAISIAMVWRSVLAQQHIGAQLAAGVATVFLLLFCIYFPLINLGSRVVTAIQVGGLFRPGAIRNGDVLLYRGSFTHNGEYARGDIVMYRLHARTVAGPQGAAGYYVREGHGVDRIIGLAGDHVHMHEGTLFVNGLPVPQERRPLGVLSGIGDFAVDVPTGKCFILPSLFELHGLHGPDERLRSGALLTVAFVSRSDILGPVFWRCAPSAALGRCSNMPSRFSRLEFDENRRRRKEPANVGGTPTRNAAHFLQQGHDAYRTGRFEEALRQYTRCLRDDRACIPAWVGQVQMLVELAEYSEARLWSDKALELFRGQGELLASQAQALARQGDVDAAQRASDQSLRSPGSSAWRWQVRGEVLLARGESLYEDCFEKALAEPNVDWFDRIVIGRVGLFYGKPALAVAYLRQASEMRPQHPYVWRVLGECQRALGWNDMAATSFRRCLELAPKDEAARRQLSELAHEPGIIRWWRRLWSFKR